MKQEYRVGVGASSILMIFVVLSLTTLGVLSFASARANLTMATRRTAQVEAYYAAAAEAQCVLAEIDTALLAAQAEPETYYESVLALSDDRLAVSDDLTITFSLPVSATQKLEVIVRAEGPEAGERYALLAHRLVSIAAWEPDTLIFN